jgi:hypothetical protein
MPRGECIAAAVSVGDSASSSDKEYSLIGTGASSPS